MGRSKSRYIKYVPEKYCFGPAVEALFSPLLLGLGEDDRQGNEAITTVRYAFAIWLNEKFFKPLKREAPEELIKQAWDRGIAEICSPRYPFNPPNLPDVGMKYLDNYRQAIGRLVNRTLVNDRLDRARAWIQHLVPTDDFKFQRPPAFYRSENWFREKFPEQYVPVAEIVGEPAWAKRARDIANGVDEHGVFGLVKRCLEDYEKQASFVLNGVAGSCITPTDFAKVHALVSRYLGDDLA